MWKKKENKNIHMEIQTYTMTTSCKSTAPSWPIGYAGTE